MESQYEFIKKVETAKHFGIPDLMELIKLLEYRKKCTEYITIYDSQEEAYFDGINKMISQLLGL